ncbi:branched-chain amino acid ABC transporter substrate-binding protein [Rhodobium gokarnense]|uniref:Branched-chain amino acid transport system substrate-binding protein n=1 Tax=Rhodobium gokarnense TaxID=364296 RepID=A0ABT3H935_9HYPH|nr:branched-chain amino acid ABC transporter substrate-binding protein [Rhodobium gokarnense]MCW2306894.1 branched-chain amino acid transport system substrate-binding protein [Rhodobium gokarnense]
MFSKLRMPIVIAVVGAMSVAGSAYAQETAKIAFIGPLTGGNSAAGIGGRNSAQVAIDQANANPDSKYKYELVALDDECKPNVGIQVATRAATSRDIVAGVTHYCSAVGIAAVDVYHRFQLPVIVWGAILPAITYGNDYAEIHRVNGSMLDENRVSARFLTEMGYKKWVVIYDTTDYGKGHLEIFKKMLADTDGEILGEFGVGSDQQDFTAELLKVKQIEPQIVLFAGLTPLGVRIRSQMDRLGLDIQFAGVSGIMSVSYLDALGETSEGTISFHNGAPFEALPGGKAFVEAYDAEGFDDPAEPYGPFAYAATKIIIDAVEEVGPDRAAVNKAISATKDLPTIVGDITFDDHGQNSVDSTKYVAQDGKWVRWEDSEYASGARKLKGQ